MLITEVKYPHTTTLQMQEILSQQAPQKLSNYRLKSTSNQELQKQPDTQKEACHVLPAENLLSSSILINLSSCLISSWKKQQQQNTCILQAYSRNIVFPNQSASLPLLQSQSFGTEAPKLFPSNIS